MKYVLISSYINNQIFSYIDNEHVKHSIPVQKIIKYIKDNSIKPEIAKLDNFDIDLSHLDKSRVAIADTKFPIIVDPAFSSKSHITCGVIDGMHRIRKLKEQGKKYVKVYFVNCDTIE